MVMGCFGRAESYTILWSPYKQLRNMVLKAGNVIYILQSMCENEVSVLFEYLQ